MGLRVITQRRRRRLIQQVIAESLVLAAAGAVAGNAAAYISYAKWNSRVNGCGIDVLNDQGGVSRTEQFQAESFAY